MQEQLNYAEMLEIPVNTVSVTRKRSFFRRGKKVKGNIKDLVIDSVNERVGGYVYSENLSDEQEEEVSEQTAISDKGSTIVLYSSYALAGLLALGIFVTNVFMPNSAINTFISSFGEETKREASYSEMTLSPVVSERSTAKMSVAENGVMSVVGEGMLYPVCNGKVSAVVLADGKYTVEIAHTSQFSTVYQGLSQAYYAEGDSVKSNIPLGYLEADGEVKVSMYNAGELLNSYTLLDSVPVFST